ncbi:MAG: hypothetical protein QF406_13665, partial [Verrucomicrobiota bacterium]|nr:hypothetical protein [Verrucomicrobiota bacterium]
EESVIGMECHQYGDSIENLDLKQVNRLNNNTANISQLAARWSLNPAALKPEIFAKSVGITGELFPAASETETD